jgi:hypothetical protein
MLFVGMQKLVSCWRSRAQLVSASNPKRKFPPFKDTLYHHSLQVIEAISVDNQNHMNRQKTVISKDDVLYVGNARDYHTIDWYRATNQLLQPRRVVFITDLIASENHARLINKDDTVINLLNVDCLLLPGQSKLGNLWRNFVKGLLLPIQVIHLRRIIGKHRNHVHAHTMYYMVLCWLAKIRFIGTPQGSEILVRPYRSKLYKFFTVRALRASQEITVDSEKMRIRVQELSGRRAQIVQYGIDSGEIKRVGLDLKVRSKITSIRGVSSNYRTHEIFSARRKSRLKPRLDLFYPMIEEGYYAKTMSLREPGDIDHGRIPTKQQMYALLWETLLAISIPKSDSSPRTVYEAIFCGTCVAVTEDLWIDSLPSCMKSRLILVDLDDEFWLDKAITAASEIVKQPFHPTPHALEKYDTFFALKPIVEKLYRNESSYGGAKV